MEIKKRFIEEYSTDCVKIKKRKTDLALVSHWYVSPLSQIQCRIITGFEEQPGKCNGFMFFGRVVKYPSMSVTSFVLLLFSWDSTYLLVASLEANSCQEVLCSVSSNGKSKHFSPKIFPPTSDNEDNISLTK